MKEYTFFTDLDNTLIYSYKHEIGEQKKSVELYQGRWISYMTNETGSLLRRIREKCPVVPITTRTIEQYERIDLGVGDFPYALTCNGGVLLINGQEDNQWYQESLKLVASATGQLKAAFDYLEKDPRRTFETRLIRDLFVFTKCDCPEQVVEDLKTTLDLSLVEVFHNGVKVYVVPITLNKGNAVTRFTKRFLVKKTLATGDSEFDVSMLNSVDIGIAPVALNREFALCGHVELVPEEELFSEGALRRIWEILAGKA